LRSGLEKRLISFAQRGFDWNEIASDFKEPKRH
jgi:hypothetical protein